MAEIVGEPGRPVDELAIGPEGFGAEIVQQRSALRVGKVGLPGEIGQQRGRRDRLQIGSADIGMTIFRGDDLALFGDADAGLDRACRQGKYGVEAGSAPPAHGAAAAMEEAHAHVAPPRRLH